MISRKEQAQGAPAANAAGKLAFPLLAALLLVCAPCLAVDTTLTIRATDGLILMEGTETDLRSTIDRLRERKLKPMRLVETLNILRDIAPAPIRLDLYYSTSVASGSSWSDAAIQRTTLAAAVRAGTIPNIVSRNPMDAYLLLRAEGAEMRLIGEPPADSPDSGEASVYLRASLVNSDYSRIFINGEGVRISEVGYLLVVLDPDGRRIIDKDDFCTFRDYTEGEAMEKFLRAQPDGAILLGVNFMGSGVFSLGGALDALRLYGIAAPVNPEIPASHAFVGRKGAPMGTGHERLGRDSTISITAFPKSAYINESEIATLAEKRGSFTVVIAGFTPDSEVIVIK